MQAMELVDVEDVYPYEEGGARMNPRDVSSRECRAYIAQLAEQFRYNRLNPGQPRVRPILYRDGGIYWIIDGECRYEAMRLAGTKRFYADVYDDLGDAELARREAAKAMVETDAKRALTPEEMSRGVQAMLALDVPEEEVAAVARVDAGKVRRARRGSEAVGDAAYDMTLDRLAAIAEFEGDDAAVAKLRDCAPGEWRRVYDGMVAERARREAVREMAEAARAAGATVVEETPDGYAAARTFSAANRAAFDELVAGGCVGEVALAGPYGVTFLEPAVDQGEGERRERQEYADFVAAVGDAALARARWIGARVGDLPSMRATARYLTRKALEGRDVGGFEEATGAKVSSPPCPLSVAVGYASVATVSAYGAWAAAREGRTGALCGKAAGDMLGLLEAMEADGYAPGDAERTMAEACRAALGEEAGDER